MPQCLETSPEALAAGQHNGRIYIRNNFFSEALLLFKIQQSWSWKSRKYLSALLKASRDGQCRFKLLDPMEELQRPTWKVILSICHLLKLCCTSPWNIRCVHTGSDITLSPSTTSKQKFPSVIFSLVRKTELWWLKHLSAAEDILQFRGLGYSSVWARDSKRRKMVLHTLHIKLNT